MTTNQHTTIPTDIGQAVTLVAVYSDGMGTFQARCYGCPWVGRWVRSEDRAVDQAKAHTHEEAQ